MAFFPLQIPWTTKPPLGTPIDWGNPLTWGLVGAWAFNEGGGNTVFDSVNPRSGTINANTGSFKTEGLYIGGGSNGNTTVALGKVSAPIVYTGVSIVNIKSLLAGSVIVTSDTTCFGLGSFGTDGSGAIQDSAGISSFPAGTITTGNHVIATIHSMTNLMSLFIDKSVVFTAQQYKSPTSPTIIYVGRAWYGSDITLKAYLAYNRALSVAELQSLSANPWQIYKPQTMWVDLGGGGAAAAYFRRGMSNRIGARF